MKKMNGHLHVGEIGGCGRGLIYLIVIVLFGECYSEYLVLVTDTVADCIFKSAIHNGSSRLQFSAVFKNSTPPLVHPASVEYDPVERHIYWSDRNYAAIFRSYLDGTSQEIVVDPRVFSSYLDGTSQESVEDSWDLDSLENIRALSLDTIERKIYWIGETSEKAIYSSNFDGSDTVMILGNLNDPRAIVVNSQHDICFFGDRKRIVRFKLSSVSDLADFPASGLVTAVTVDFTGEVVYWFDKTALEIRASNFDFVDVRSIVDMNINNHSQARGLALYESGIYWINVNSAVFRADKDTGYNIDAVSDMVFENPSGLFIYYSSTFS
ncbi:low-density lipoprotein receptor-related protein 8-like [Anneissia japonica]|uniref:low-density lipoprotein receptor-related protein 8-like n=1 Tax=Anneissia japonica TaxID=1529436 RepID=UPI0014256F0F|nr:low-density lipoprotein receptor-related protein 8-like [Anneissia japonica]